MQIRYEGSTCETCGTKPTMKNCGPCLRKNGRPAYRPKEGVKLDISEGYTFDGKDRPIPTRFIKVVH